VTQTKLTPKQLLDRMRAHAAELLGYDLNAKLSGAQRVRLDRAATMMLALDDVQSKQLAGLDFDAKAYVVASESLERLVGGDPEQAADQLHDFRGAREQLLHFLDGRAEALERRAKSLEAANNAVQNQDSVTMAVQNQDCHNQEPPPPAPEPLPSNVMPIRESPAERYARINPVAPTPAQPLPPSPVTQSYFSNVPGSVNSGMRRFDPPRNF
jgi:hypothetical protein